MTEYKGSFIGDYIYITGEKCLIRNFYIRTRGTLVRHMKSNKNIEVSCGIIKEGSPSIWSAKTTTCIGVAKLNRKRFV